MKTFLITALALLAACSSRQEQGYAQITQRRVDTRGQLVLTYRFYAEGKWIQDSTVIANQVVPHDSVKLVYAPEHPEESRLLLP